MKHVAAFRFRSSELAGKLHRAENALRKYVIKEDERMGQDEGSGLCLPKGRCRGAILIYICRILGIITIHPDAEDGCPTSDWMAPAIVAINPIYSLSTARDIALEIIGANDCGCPTRACELAVQVLWFRREHLRKQGSHKDDPPTGGSSSLGVIPGIALLGKLLAGGQCRSSAI